MRAMDRNGTVGGILVADPEERSRAVICGYLRQAGHEVIELASGEEALEAASRQRPALVILEVCLPGICGYEVCRRLRDEYAEDISIVFVSATRTESFDRVAGILLGADDYLSKPLAADELLARVGRLIRRPRALNTMSRLTEREREVLGLLQEGLRQREVAERLCISNKTVGTHVEHIYSKLGARHRLQAVALAQRQHLVSSSS
jgi:DNA-binding NarL/FixJ family response regulator